MKLAEQRKIGRQDILFCMARAADSSRVFCGSSDFKVYELDLAADEPARRTFSGHRSYVTGAALTAHGTLVTCGYDRQLVWWDVESGKPFRRTIAHERWARKVAASPDGTLVASVADDMVARVWNAWTGDLLDELRGHEPLTPQHFHSMLYTCVFSPDGEFLATADRVGHVVVWELASGNPVATLESPEHYTWDPRQRRRSIGGVRSLAFAPDGNLLAVGGVGQIGNVDGLGGKALVHVYDWRRGERTHKFEHDGHKGLVEDLHFLRDGRQLLAGGGAQKGFLLLVDVERQEFVYDTEAPMHVHQLDLDLSTNQLIAVGHGAVVVWQMDDEA